MITKYKDIDYQLQSSRKVLKKTSASYFFPIAIFFILYFITDGGIPLDYCIELSLIFIAILFVNLFQRDWSITFENDILTVRKWIFKFNIPFKDLINIAYNRYRNNNYYYNILIKYKKGNSIRYLTITYCFEIPFLKKFEYAKEDEVSEFINIFVREEELINNKTETNISDGNYRNIRTEQEKNELKDFLQKKKKSEEKNIWILLFSIIFVSVVFLTIVTVTGDGEI